MQNKSFTKAVKPLAEQKKAPGKKKKLTKSVKNHGSKFVFLLIGILGISFFALWYFWEEPLISPLSSLTTFEFIKGEFKEKPEKKKIVYGFLPYWSLNKVTIQPEITHLSYFSLSIAADGTIVTLDEDGNEEPGYNKLDSDQLTELTNQVLSTNKDKFDITLTQFDNDDIAALLSNPEAHQNLLTSLDSIILAYPVSGVNIDIEYSGEVNDILREDMVTLMRTINNHLDTKYDNVQLSIDMYAGAADKKQIWDVENIGKEVDYIVVMAYDFHRRSSTQSGPVAPLFGDDESSEKDINHYLKKYLEVVPSKKILLGVPFYGYEWRTTSTEPGATTYQGTGATATYKRVKEILEQEDTLFVEEHWDNTALSPYLTYVEDDEIYTIYYENPRSIEYKMEYVNQLDLAGIAIWALGYEGDDRDLWNIIEKKIE